MFFPSVTCALSDSFVVPTNTQLAVRAIVSARLPGTGTLDFGVMDGNSPNSYFGKVVLPAGTDDASAFREVEFNFSASSPSARVRFCVSGASSTVVFDRVEVSTPPTWCVVNFRICFGAFSFVHSTLSLLHLAQQRAHSSCDGARRVDWCFANVAPAARAPIPTTSAGPESMLCNCCGRRLATHLFILVCLRSKPCARCSARLRRRTFGSRGSLFRVTVAMT